MSGDHNMYADSSWPELYNDSVGERTGRISITLEEYSANSPITVIKEFTDDNCDWPHHLAVFIRALEAQFGYSIMERVFIKENGFGGGLANWPGGTIDVDDYKY